MILGFEWGLSAACNAACGASSKAVRRATVCFMVLVLTVIISVPLPYSTANFSMGITASSALLLLPWRWPLLE